MEFGIFGYHGRRRGGGGHFWFSHGIWDIWLPWDSPRVTSAISLISTIPNRKAHLSLGSTANLAFRQSPTHVTLSVFHADQHGGGTFLIPTLWPQIWGPSSSPWGSPTSARPGTDFRACFTKNTLLGIIKLGIWNFFLTLPDIWVRFWSHPQSHGELQHQQGQEVILKHILWKTYF